MSRLDIEELEKRAIANKIREFLMEEIFDFLKWYGTSDLEEIAFHFNISCQKTYCGIRQLMVDNKVVAIEGKDRFNHSRRYFQIRG